MESVHRSPIQILNNEISLKMKKPSYAKATEGGGGAAGFSENSGLKDDLQDQKLSFVEDFDLVSFKEQAILIA